MARRIDRLLNETEEGPLKLSLPTGRDLQAALAHSRESTRTFVVLLNEGISQPSCIELKLKSYFCLGDAGDRG